MELKVCLGGRLGMALSIALGVTSDMKLQRYGLCTSVMSSLLQCYVNVSPYLPRLLHTNSLTGLHIWTPTYLCFNENQSDANSLQHYNPHY